MIKKLGEMFEIQGQFLPHNKWIVVFTDDEGDMMFSRDRSMEVSNYHIQCCKMAKKIFIYTSGEVNRMATKLKISLSLENEDIMD
ncbi:hypothetical protein YC2023_109007 [Brassica napus]